MDVPQTHKYLGMLDGMIFEMVNFNRCVWLGLSPVISVRNYIGVPRLPYIPRNSCRCCQSPDTRRSKFIQSKLQTPKFKIRIYLGFQIFSETFIDCINALVYRVLSASMHSRKKIYPLKTGRDPA